MPHLDARGLRGQVAIVGAADTAVGKVPGIGPTELCIDAAKRALNDSGLAKDAIDGLITCNSMAEPYMYHAEAMAEYLQIFPGYCMSVGAGGGTTFSILHHAASAIATGFWLASLGKNSTSTSLARVSNCLIAAGR